MDVDYNKLAEGNRIVLLCRDKINTIRKDKNKKNFLDQFNVGYKFSFFYLIKFLKHNQDVAQKVLGNICQICISFVWKDCEIVFGNILGKI